MNETKIKEDVFWDEYIPIENHLDDNASWSGCMFETYGNELKYVQEKARKGKNVWTIMEDEDGMSYIVADMHFVNRLGYIITRKEWTTGEEQVEDDE